MQQQKWYIKGMVCARCIASVRAALEGPGITVEEVKLGEVVLTLWGDADKGAMEQKLQQGGFTLLQDKKARLVEDTKSLVAEVYSGHYDFNHHFRFTEKAAQKLAVAYDAISSAFTAVEGTTLEQYILRYRIEKIKEWLVYTDGTLADAAFAFGFSSVAHLSRQFKMLTGLPPSHFRSIRKAGADTAAPAP